MADVRQRRRPEAAAVKPETASATTPAEQADNDIDDWSWSNYSSWPPLLKFGPFYLIIAVILSILFYNYYMLEPRLDLSTYETCKDTFNFTFHVNAARHQAENLATHSWEYGTAAEAIGELVDPDHSVFGREPFPDGHVPWQGLHMDQALIWVYQRISTRNSTLFPGDTWGVSDPAALGVSAVMIGQRWKEYHAAAERQKDFLLQEAPRYINGAVSHRRDVAELWSDAVSMFPPFLAYYGVHKGDLALVREAVRQVQLYRDVLSYSEGAREHLWKHIVGPSDMADEGAWSTGNGWAAYGERH